MRNAVVFGVLVLVWILSGLFPHEPWKADEAYSFGIVHDILRTGDWVVPTVAGEPFMEKPPLFYVTAAGLARLFSPLLKPHDGARLASGLYLIVAFLFAGLSGRRLWGTGRGTTTIALLMGSAGLLLASHLLVTDVALMAGCSVAIFGMTLALERPVAGGIWLGLGTGIGFLSKGLLAPGIFGLASILLPVLSPPARTKRYALCLVTALVVALPALTIWPLALYRESPSLFRDWLWTNNVGRFFGFARLGPPKRGTYLTLLFYYAFPAYPLALWAMWRRGRDVAHQPAFAVPLAVFIATWGLLEASAQGRDLYAIPMLLPLSLLAASVVPALPTRASAFLDRLGTVSFEVGFMALWALWAALSTGHPVALARWLHRMNPGYVPDFRPLSSALAVLFSVAWLALVASRRPRPDGERAVLDWAAGTSLCWGVAMAVLLPWLDSGNSYRSVTESLARNIKPGQEIARLSVGESQRAMFDYYAGIETRPLSPGGSDTAGLLLVQARRGDSDAALPGWVEVWEGSRPGDRKECFRLYRRVAEPTRNTISSAARAAATTGVD